VGFSGDDANIWGAIEGEFSEKGEETGPVTPDASHHYLPGGASCRTHGQCKSGFCRRGTCTADDDWRNQAQTAYYSANWNKSMTSTPVVYSFAALGFGFIMYGAAKHYLGGKPEEESTPFDL